MSLRTRLARLTVPELKFRARETVETLREAFAVSGGPPAWRREHLLARLDEDDKSLADARRSLASGHWVRAERELRAHFARRGQRFIIDPTSRSRVARNITAEFPGAPIAAAGRAD